MDECYGCGIGEDQEELEECACGMLCCQACVGWYER